MHIFFSEEVLYFINTVSQLVIAISAVVAIIIAIKQTRYKGKANIKGYYKCKLGMIEHNDSKELEVVSGISIKIINLGLSPVYIENCEIEFAKKIRNKNNPGFMTVSDVVCIKPGESYIGSIPLKEFIIDDINDKVSIHDKVYVYAQLCNGKIRKWKTKVDYASFKHEAEKIIRRARESCSLMGVVIGGAFIEENKN